MLKNGDWGVGGGVRGVRGGCDDDVVAAVVVAVKGAVSSAYTKQEASKNVEIHKKKKY